MDNLVTVLQHSSLSSFQDHGRPGFAQLGIPMGGALDRFSAAMSNWLVSNPDCEPVLEIQLWGPSLHFENEAIIAITGANCHPLLNGQSIEINQTVLVPKSSVLQIRGVQNKCRSYLAIQGTWALPKWVDSVSPIQGFGMQHFLGNPLQKGYSWSISNKDKLNFTFKHLNIDKDTDKELTLLPGPEWHILNQQQKKQLRTNFTIDLQANRMGYRLHPKLIPPQQKGIISSAVLPGTVQLTPSGQLIIIMADGQTIGGYPRIGQIDNYDLDILTQKKPGDIIRLKFEN